MKHTNETGRSMVEMLGVLAIIGVLSIGGIAGYTMAMNKYEANQIVNAVMHAAVECRTGNGDNAIKEIVAENNYFVDQDDPNNSLKCADSDKGTISISLCPKKVNPEVQELVRKALGSNTEYTPAS